MKSGFQVFVYPVMLFAVEGKKSFLTMISEGIWFSDQNMDSLKLMVNHPPSGLCVNFGPVHHNYSTCADCYLQYRQLSVWN